MASNMGCLPIRDNDPGDGALSQAFRTLLIFSFALLSLPVIGFFVTKHYIFEGMYGHDTSMSVIYAAVVSVVAVHVIVGLFIYVAWKESNAPSITPAFKQD